MKNIVLIGMMACGKTTCGGLLAEALGRELVDTDQLLVAREGRSVSEIFAEEGEAYFRDRESEIARELGARSGLIIATGGGMPLREENAAALRANGLVFWLKRSPEETFQSVSMEGRPLAQDGQEAFVRRFREREPRYRAAAHVVIEGCDTPEEAVAHILEEVNRRDGEGAEKR